MFCSDCSTRRDGSWHGKPTDLNRQGLVSSKTDYNGNTTLYAYDGQGYRLKEITTSGGTPTEKRLVPITGNHIIQERDATNTVTARYYWFSEARPIRIGVARIHGRKSRWGVSGEDGTFFKPRQAASGSSLKLRKDHGTSTKYFVPETWEVGS